MISGKGRASAIGAAIALLLALIGCGSGGATAEQAKPPPPLTKEQLVEKLDEICQGHTERQVRVREVWQQKRGLDFEKETQPQLEKEMVVVILPIVRDTIREIEQLRPNRRQKEDLRSFLEALEYGVANSMRDPSWVATGDREPFAMARKLSWKLGTALCGQA